MKYFVINNVKAEDLQYTLNMHIPRGWTLDRMVAIKGDIGSTFTVVLKK